MVSFKEKFILRLVTLLDVFMLTIPFAIAWFNFYCTQLVIPYGLTGSTIIIGLYIALYITYSCIYEGYDLFISRVSELVGSQALAVILSDFFMYIIMILLMKRLPNIIPMIFVAGAQIGLSAIWANFAHKWYFNGFKAIQTLVIYDMRDDIDTLVNAYGLDKKFDIVANYDIKTALSNKDEIFKGIGAVFISGVHSHERNCILKYCVAKNIRVYVIPRLGDMILAGAKRRHLFHLPMLEVNRYNPSPEFLFLKRLFDIVISLSAIIILSPIFLIVAIAIKCTDHGPVFYKQCRLTKNGKTFNVIKFRSMRVDAEKDGVARLSSGENDDRVTPIGKIIRKFRIDELPQLFNILEGSMSIVGPRPERPEIAAEYEKELPEFALRLQAKAGLTGYAQVYGKYNTIPYDKLIMDLMYISNPRISEDFKIIFATIKILFSSESTEGVSSDQTTALK